MMLKDWLLLLLLSALALIALVVLVDHIKTEMQYHKWYKDQQRRKK